MTNLENKNQFLFEDDIELINKFIGKPTAIEIEKNVKDVSPQTQEFIYRLATAIREKSICKKKCIFRKGDKK